MFDKKDKNSMNRQEARDLILDWADFLEVDTDLDHFQEVIDELTLPVMNERLTFDKENEVFKYSLIKPLIKKDDSHPIALVEIRETEMNDNKDIQRFRKRERTEQATAMLANALGIEPGFISRMKQRDINRCNAVILGFFVQAAPSQTTDD